jgi:hypothetical protein
MLTKKSTVMEAVQSKESTIPDVKSNFRHLTS